MPLEILFLILRILVIICLYVFVFLAFSYARKEMVHITKRDFRPLVQASLKIIEVENTNDSIESEVHLGKKITIGRDNRCDVKINDPFVSLEHAKIVEEDSVFYLFDLDSKNGTTINGVHVTEKTALINGDSIEIGDVKLLFNKGMVL